MAEDIKLVEVEMPPAQQEVWIYFGSQQQPQGWRGYWTGTEFKRATNGPDITQPNVWGWRHTNDDDPVDVADTPGPNRVG